jgi:hypothetical protein
LWQPFKDHNPAVTSRSSITSSDFWNLPPAKSFENAITTSRGKELRIQWPPGNLPATSYYISLYFQDNRKPSPHSWRLFTVSLNGKNFYTDLNATTSGVTVYAAHWPLSGQTEIVLTPSDGMPVGPLINAAEIYQILPLGGRTLARDGSPSSPVLFVPFYTDKYYLRKLHLSYEVGRLLKILLTFKTS